MAENDIHHVTIRNVTGFSAGGHHIVRFLNASGVRLYDVELENLLDTTPPEGFRCQEALRIGDCNQAWGGVTPLGDTFNIKVKNVCSRATRAVAVFGSLTDSEISDVINQNPENPAFVPASGEENIRNVKVDGLFDMK